MTMIQVPADALPASDGLVVEIPDDLICPITLTVSPGVAVVEVASRVCNGTRCRFKILSPYTIRSSFPDDGPPAGQSSRP